MKLALERRESVCQPHRSRGADSAALTEELPNPEPQKAERPRKGAAPKYRGLHDLALTTQSIQHSIEPGQARKCATGERVPSFGQRGLGMTEESHRFAAQTRHRGCHRSP
jgi:hypothetical protein